MTETQTVPGTPPNPAEPTVQTNAVDAKAETEKELEVLKNKVNELQAQKEHWREKYERDITSQKSNEPALSEEEVFSDEGKALKSEISSLNEKFHELEKREVRKELESEFSVLKDKREEFDEFLSDEENKRLSLKKAAKLFLAEKGYLNSEPERKGLEKPTAGGQTPPNPNASKEEIENLRKNNYREYVTRLRKGEFDRI